MLASVVHIPPQIVGALDFLMPRGHEQVDYEKNEPPTIT